MDKSKEPSTQLGKEIDDLDKELDDILKNVPAHSVKNDEPDPNNIDYNDYETWYNATKQAEAVPDTPKDIIEHTQVKHFAVNSRDKKANEESRKKMLENGPQDYKWAAKPGEESLDQINHHDYYYRHYAQLSGMYLDSPYLGLERVIKGFSPVTADKSFLAEVDKALNDIKKIECRSKKCDLVQNKVAHFHCKHCGMPYDLNFGNYHDLANRYSNCVECGNYLDYGKDFDKTWHKLQKSVQHQHKKALARYLDEKRFYDDNERRAEYEKRANSFSRIPNTEKPDEFLDINELGQVYDKTNNTSYFFNSDDKENARLNEDLDDDL